MKKNLATYITALTLLVALAVPAQLAAQDKQAHLHRTLGTGNNALATQSQSSALGGGGSFNLNYWRLLSQVVDDQKGSPSVDPLSLQPPAILNNDNPAAHPRGNYHTYKACWKVTHPGPLDPPGTAIKCYSSPVTFELGDGSLASNPNGNPDETFGGLPCPLVGTQQFLWVDQLTAYWNAVRFYDASEQLIEGYRLEAYAGRIYNYTTGKSIPAWMDYVSTYEEEPGPDGTDSNLQWGYYGNDFSAQAGNTPVFTPQWAVITYTPNFASVIEEQGPHPLDDYLNTGATAGLAPICTAME
ncbi:MAG: hypothetical protein WCA20_19080 [Candidatus Sulfotelmatobacter sp.]